jgi:hypothetical protein
MPYTYGIKMWLNVFFLLLFFFNFQIIKQLDALAILEDTDNSTFNINVLCKFLLHNQFIHDLFILYKLFSIVTFSLIGLYPGYYNVLDTFLFILRYISILKWFL